MCTVPSLTPFGSLLKCLLIGEGFLTISFEHKHTQNQTWYHLRMTPFSYSLFFFLTASPIIDVFVCLFSPLPSTSVSTMKGGTLFFHCCIPPSTPQSTWTHDHCSVNSCHTNEWTVGVLAKCYISPIVFPTRYKLTKLLRPTQGYYLLRCLLCSLWNKCIHVSYPESLQGASSSSDLPRL